jgi:hypothetical protein
MDKFLVGQTEIKMHYHYKRYLYKEHNTYLRWLHYD